MAQARLVGERVKLQLEAWGRSGEAVAYLDGRQMFVFGGIPGEGVIAEVIQEHRRYRAARVVEVVKASPHRISSPCPYFGPCTGCQWQHLDYSYQLQLKQDMVTDALHRVGGFQEPPVLATIASPEHYEYRNHARFTVGPEGTLGFVNRETQRFIAIDRCMLMHPGINRILKKLQGRCNETTQLSVRYGANTRDFLVQPPLGNRLVPIPSGQERYTESLKGKKFSVASPSFFQVNIRQMEQMVDLVRDRLQLSGTELIVDAYAGVGTFAILLAPHASRVIAIEESASAVSDGKANAEGVAGVEFLQGRTEEVLGQLEERPHGVILDPPRKGCHIDTLAALARQQPRRVVYVSCDPTTLGRDLKVLCAGPFRLEEVQPIDMFPQTHHVECVATLSCKRTLEGLILASTSPRRQQLLSTLGVAFHTVPPLLEEEHVVGEVPQAMVQRLALAKAQRVAALHPNAPVVAADTIVVLEGRILGKPRDEAEATHMLRRLRGQQHQVVSGVALVDGELGPSLSDFCVSIVTMRDYSDREIRGYIASGRAGDKSGAYGIQDEAFHPASRIAGCYTNVVGLPLCTLIGLLRRMGFTTEGLHLPEGCMERPSQGEKVL